MSLILTETCLSALNISLASVQGLKRLWRRIHLTFVRTSEHHPKFFARSVIVKNAVFNLFRCPAKLPAFRMVPNRVANSRLPGLHFGDPIQKSIENGATRWRQTNTPVIDHLPLSPSLI